MEDDTDTDWKTCSSTGPWVSNSLKERAQDLRMAAVLLRKRHAGRFYEVPANFLADAYDEAAAGFERQIAALSTSESTKK